MQHFFGRCNHAAGSALDCKHHQAHLPVRAAFLMLTDALQSQQAAIDSLAAEYLQSTRNRGMVHCPSGVLSPLHFRMSCVRGKYGDEL